MNIIAVAKFTLSRMQHLAVKFSLKNKSLRCFSEVFHGGLEVEYHIRHNESATLLCRARYR